MADNKKYLKLLGDYEKHCIRIAQATSINIHETPEEKLRRIKDLEKDYVKWFEYYFPNFAKKKCAWFHKKLAKLIINNNRLRLLAEMYRSAGKSVHIDMGIPLYLYLVKHDLKFMLLIGETEAKAAKLLSGIQAELQHNNRIKNDYGEKFQEGDWAKGDFVTTDGVRFMSLGFRQNPRGAREQAERPDYIVVDDVDSKLHVNNDKLMEESLDFITEDVWGCFDSEETGNERFVYANNNFNKKSITNRLKEYFTKVIKKEQELKQEKTTKFKVLKVCAVKDLVNFEPEWEAKASAKYWREKYEDNPISFLREYMHVHVTKGKIFKNEYIQYGKPLPLDQYDALTFYGDLSYKEEGDFKSMILVGKKGKEFHVLLVFLRQTSRALLAEWLYDMYEKYNLANYNITYMIEGLFSMDEFVNDFDEEGEKRGYYIPVIASKERKGNKYDRIESLVGFFIRRNVILNIFLRNGVDMEELITQLLGFQKGSQLHDDGPDALHGSMSNLNAATVPKEYEHAYGERIDNHY